MLYNGRQPKEFNMARCIALVDQIDVHNPILTVRETLEFAHICQVRLLLLQLRQSDSGGGHYLYPFSDCL